MRLSHRDFEMLLDVVAELYAHVDLETLPHKILSAVARLIPGDGNCYNQVDPASKQVVAIHRPGLPGLESHLPALGEFIHEHPLWLRADSPAKMAGRGAKWQNRSRAYWPSSVLKTARKRGLRAREALEAQQRSKYAVVPAQLFVRQFNCTFVERIGGALAITCTE
jgi:hypothetical protein